MDKLVKELLSWDDPCVRYRTLVDVCGISPDSAKAKRERKAIKASPRAKALLSHKSRNGHTKNYVYAKYTGPHWALVDLADIGYPPGDQSLEPIRDQVYDFWLSPSHMKERTVDREAARYKSSPGVPIMDGRARRCASQEGNALYSTIALGLTDERTDQLQTNLIRWQWPDGGWNCDRKVHARTSSFHESLLPIRGLVWCAKLTGSSESKCIIEEAVEFFLKRQLCRRVSDGSIIHESFLKLKYPPYWHYNILIALKVMAEAGYIAPFPERF